MLYTKKGDSGTTTLYGRPDKFLKSAPVFEALGALDEANAFIGLCKVKSSNEVLSKALENIQHQLFILQAELAGAKKFVTYESVAAMEEMIDSIEGQLPPIRTFLLSGGTELSALLDVARTIIRRAERSIILADDSGVITISAHSKAYINRLSSLLYTFVRQENQKFSVLEQAPHY